MSSFKHGMKKRLSKATTSTKTIESNISADYVTAKQRLQKEKKALHNALGKLQGAGTAWGKVADVHTSFAELIESQAPVDGPLRPMAASALSGARGLHADYSAPLALSDDSAKMIGHVKAYISEIEAIEKEYKEVETAFTETQRYEKKVAKLSSKDSKAEKTQRNIVKLQGSRATLKSILDANVARMEKTSAKYEAILQCVMTAFWLRQEKYVASVVEKSKEARSIATGISEQVAAIDVSKDELKVVEPVSYDAQEDAAVDQIEIQNVPTETPKAPMVETSAAAPTGDVLPVKN